MNRYFIIMFGILVNTCYVFSQDRHKIENDAYSCFYETSQGRLNGSYISYYKNGQIRSKGTFRNNYRIGVWSVWDSNGNLRMKRKYSDPFTFKRLFPKMPNDKPIKLLNVPQYSINYNRDGYIEDYYLREMNVVMVKNIWRYISPEFNPILFKDDLLIKVIIKNIEAGNINPVEYEAEADLLLSYGDTNKYSKTVDFSKYKVIGYKIWEEWIFDNDRMVSFYAITGIVPVAVHKFQNDTTDLFFIYLYPFRKYLAKEKINQNHTPQEINTLDDLFFFRYFSSQIVRESGDDYNRKFYFKEAPDINSTECEINIIEDEHDIWMKFTGFQNTEE